MVILIWVKVLCYIFKPAYFQLWRKGNIWDFHFGCIKNEIRFYEKKAKLNLYFYTVNYEYEPTILEFWLIFFYTFFNVKHLKRVLGGWPVISLCCLFGCNVIIIVKTNHAQLHPLFLMSFLLIRSGSWRFSIVMRLAFFLLTL